MLRAIREADALDLGEKISRAWTFGDCVARRLPHAVHTPVLEWATKGKMWEMDEAKTPASLGLHEGSFGRRLIGVRKNASFTSEPDEVDPVNKAILADSDLGDKL